MQKRSLITLFVLSFAVLITTGACKKKQPVTGKSYVKSSTRDCLERQETPPSQTAMPNRVFSDDYMQKQVDECVKGGGSVSDCAAKATPEPASTTSPVTSRVFSDDYMQAQVDECVKGGGSVSDCAARATPEPAPTPSRVFADDYMQAQVDECIKGGGSISDCAAKATPAEPKSQEEQTQQPSQPVQEVEEPILVLTENMPFCDELPSRMFSDDNLQRKADECFRNKQGSYSDCVAKATEQTPQSAATPSRVFADDKMQAQVDDCVSKGGSIADCATKAKFQSTPAEEPKKAATKPGFQNPQNQVQKQEVINYCQSGGGYYNCVTPTQEDCARLHKNFSIIYHYCY